MTKGKYIVIEGPEGVGKTTMVEMVAKHLESARLPVRILREPDSQNDVTARRICQLTQDPTYPMNSRTKVLLYNAARAQSLECIRQATQNGVYCIVDRSYLSTLAVHYYGRGDIKDYDKLNELIDFAVNGVWADLTIVLDAPAAELKKHTNARVAGARFDSLNIEFLERVRTGYLWEAKQRGFPIVNAERAIDEVFADVWQLVSAEIARRPRVVAPSESSNNLSQKPESVFSQKPKQNYRLPNRLTKKSIDSFRKGVDGIIASRRQVAKLLSANIELQSSCQQLTMPMAVLFADSSDAEFNQFLGESKAAKLINHKLMPSYSSSSAPLSLISYRPHNELDLLQNLVFRYSGLSSSELRLVLDTWSYPKKLDLITALVTLDDSFVENVQYEFEFFADYRENLALQALGFSVKVQQMTPRNGFDTPKGLEEIPGASELFEKCFAESLALFSQLQTAGHYPETQLAVLVGHQQRLKLHGDARLIKQLLTISDTKLARLQRLVREAVFDVHPIMAECYYQDASKVAT